MDGKKVKFIVLEDIYWDNNCKFVKVFKKGSICDGVLYSDGDIVAQSMYHEGVYDSVNKSKIKIIQ